MVAAFRQDPLRNFKFRVQMNIPGDTSNSMANMGFMGLSGIAVQNELIAYREGGMNTSPHKLVGQTDFAPVTLTRGLFPNRDDNVYKWQNWIYKWNWGNEPGMSPGEEYRASQIDVFIMAHPWTKGHTSGSGGTLQATLDKDTVQAQITIHNAWPGAFALTDLNAGDNGILIQQMTLHHEGWDIKFGDEIVIGASGAAEGGGIRFL